jgi:hypothetical protein
VYIKKKNSNFGLKLTNNPSIHLRIDSETYRIENRNIRNNKLKKNSKKNFGSKLTNNPGIHPPTESKSFKTYKTERKSVRNKI